LIVRVVDNPSGKRPEAKNMKIVPAHILGPQGTCLAVFGFLPNAVDPGRGLKSGGFLELGRRRRETLVKLIREQAPVIILPTLDTALSGIANAIQLGRIGDRQRLQHNGLRQGEDRRGCTDADGQCK
jgi:hypothetical protein